MADYTDIGVPFSAGSTGNARPREDGPGSVVAFPHSRGARRPSHNLPLELTSFVGREREMAEVKRLLQSTRLLTLTGPGGCGKTRLALKVAQDLVQRFEDGAWLVELAPIPDPELVPQAVAQALGVRDQPGRSLTDTLADSLGPEQLLLVLDNCEHLIDACARFVETMLTSCPDLRVLATSREPLGVGGEANWLVPRLSVPEVNHLPPVEDPARYEAVRLFVERAEAMLPNFALTDHNAVSVARVCRRLSGIPLAIELAAARVKVLSIEQIAERLDDCFGLLTGGSRTALPRQRTLRATIDWSHALLSWEEQTLFRRLSVFAGGYTLEAAEAVCAGEGLEEHEVLDVLSRLVEKSLVVMRERDGEARYHSLEMVRQYGRGKLEESGEARAVRRRHAGFFLRMAEEAELTGAKQGVWLDLLEAELDNLRAAIGWSIEVGEPEMGLRFAGALSYFCYLRGYYGEGREWLEGTLPGGSASPAPLRAKALLGVGLLAFLQCEYERATALLRESMILYRELGDKRGLASALQFLGCASREQGRYMQARAFHEESLDLSRGSEDEAGIANALTHLGIVAWMEGDYERAAELCTQAIPMCRGLGETHATIWSLIVLGTVAHHHGDHELGAKLLQESLALSREGYAEGVPFSLNQLGIVAYRQGEHERATALLKESLVLHRDLGNGWRVASVLEGLAEVACAQGNHERATRLFGAGEALHETIAAPLPPCERADYDRGVAAARAGLDERSFDAAWTQGRAMTPEQAVEYALGEVEEPTDAPTTTTTPVVPEPPAGSSEKPAETVPARAKAPTLGLRIFALGPARVEKAGHPLDSPDWTHKPRELLFYLLCHPPRSKEQIGLALWPDASPAQLRSSFHDTVFRLRRALGAKEWISFEKGRYAFNRSLPHSFDVEAFEENLSEARRLRPEAPERAIGHLEEAVGLYGGDFLEDSVDSEWVMVRQEEISRAYQEALLLLGGLLFAQDRHAEAAEAYRKALAHDELLEEAHRELMRCQAALGERSRALRHYEELVELLDERLGTPPARETSALYERLRAGEEV